MASINKSFRRQKSRYKNKYGMKISNRSIFTIVGTLVKKGNATEGTNSPK